MSIADLSLSYNERLVLELVFLNQATGRAEIAERTGLTAATVTRLVAPLVDAGLLTEQVDRVGAIGQPRRRLAIAPRKVFSVGINFMRHQFDLTVVDLNGDVLAMEQFEIDTITPESLGDASARHLASVLERIGVSRSAIIGAGYSVPGNFAPDGYSLRAHDYFRALDGLDLRPTLSAALGMPCWVETDGACAAIGEYLHGVGRRHETFFLVHIGHGVGGGAVINGQLYRGPHGNASKPGVLFPYDQPRPSGQDLLETLRSAGAVVEDIATLGMVAESHWTVIDAWLDRAAGQLGQVVRVVTAFIDPELIVVGGRLPSDMNKDLVSRTGQLVLDGPSRGLPLAPLEASSLGPQSGALGAASLPMFARFFTGSIGNGHNAYVNGRRAELSGKNH